VFVVAKYSFAFFHSSPSDTFTALRQIPLAAHWRLWLAILDGDDGNHGTTPAHTMVPPTHFSRMAKTRHPHITTNLRKADANEAVVPLQKLFLLQTLRRREGVRSQTAEQHDTIGW
jgi:hypothetical protein